MYALLIMTLAAVALIIVVLWLIHDTRYGKHITFTAAGLYPFVIAFYTLNRHTVSSIAAFKFSTPFLKAIRNGHYGLVANRSLLNLLLFVPLGYLAVSSVRFLKGKPAKIERNRMLVGLACTSLAGFAVSLIIETTQLVFKLGVFDCDDLIKNTLGATIGFIIYCILNKRPKKID